MKFERCAIPDVVLCKPDVYGDHRGYFFESFREDEFNEFIGRKIEECFPEIAHYLVSALDDLTSIKQKKVMLGPITGIGSFIPITYKENQDEFWSLLLNLQQLCSVQGNRFVCDLLCHSARYC